MTSNSILQAYLPHVKVYPFLKLYENGVVGEISLNSILQGYLPHVKVYPYIKLYEHGVVGEISLNNMETEYKHYSQTCLH